MKLQVTRNVLSPASTIGMLDIDGAFQCYTLEPPIRPDKPCAIPDGTYDVRFLFSTRFQRRMWHVINVPGFVAIEIHNGNFPTDTKACTLVGQERGTDAIWRSDDALRALEAKLAPHVDDADLEITYVTNQPEA